VKPRTLLDRLSMALCAIGCVAIAVMMLLMMVDAISRKTFGSIPAAYPSTVALLTITLLIPQAYAEMRRKNIVVDLVTARLKPRTQAVLGVVMTSMAVFVFGVLTWAGAQKAWESTLAREEWMGVMMFPAWPFRWTVPIGLGLFTLQLVATLADYGRKTRGRG
jgi:TRAP-type C4-dicarboxylate transport system permease small subunit